MRLVRYSPPFSPEGKTALTPPPPYHVAHNVIQVLFRTDPETLRRFLPEPFRPAEPPDVAVAAVLDAVFTWGEEDHRLPPEFHQCLEAFLIIPCRLGERSGKYFAAVYVDRDWIFSAAHYLGMAGKLARIQLTRLHPLHRSLNRSRPGLRLDGLVERAGQRVLSLSVKLKQQVKSEQLPFSSAQFENFGLREYPGLDGTPGYRDVVLIETIDRAVGEVWEGEGSLDFGDSQLDRLSPLRPLEVLAGHFASYRYTLTGVKPLSPQPLRAE